MSLNWRQCQAPDAPARGWCIGAVVLPIDCRVQNHSPNGSIGPRLSNRLDRKCGENPYESWEALSFDHRCALDRHGSSLAFVPFQIGKLLHGRHGSFPLGSIQQGAHMPRPCSMCSLLEAYAKSRLPLWRAKYQGECAAFVPLSTGQALCVRVRLQAHRRKMSVSPQSSPLCRLLPLLRADGYSESSEASKAFSVSSSIWSTSTSRGRLPLAGPTMPFSSN